MIIQYIEWPKYSAPIIGELFISAFLFEETYFWIGIREIPEYIDCNYKLNECEWIVPGTVTE